MITLKIEESIGEGKKFVWISYFSEMTRPDEHDVKDAQLPQSHEEPQ